MPDSTKFETFQKKSKKWILGSAGVWTQASRSKVCYVIHYTTISDLLGIHEDYQYLLTFKFDGVWHFIVGCCKFFIFWNGVFLMKRSLVPCLLLWYDYWLLERQRLGNCKNVVRRELASLWFNFIYLPTYFHSVQYNSIFKVKLQFKGFDAECE